MDRSVDRWMDDTYWNMKGLMFAGASVNELWM